jgi:hypothetical protein
MSCVRGRMQKTRPSSRWARGNVVLASLLLWPVLLVGVSRCLAAPPVMLYGEDDSGLSSLQMGAFLQLSTAGRVSPASNETERNFDFQSGRKHLLGRGGGGMVAEKEHCPIQLGDLENRSLQPPAHNAKHRLASLHVEVCIRLKLYISVICLLWGISRFEAVLACADSLKRTSFSESL